jgi:PEP-CTERM motif
MGSAVGRLRPPWVFPKPTALCRRMMSMVRPTVNTAIAFSVAVFAAAFFFMSPTQVGAALLTECPAIGLDTGCGILITINADNSVTVTAASSPTQPPYDGVEDTLIGVLNNSSVAVGSLPLSSSTVIFGFDGDGICASSISPRPAGCPFGTTGYEGPGVSFSGINAARTNGIVNFGPAIGPGGSAFFGLEEALVATQITPGPPGTGVPEPSSLLLISSALLALGGAAWRRSHRN